MPELKFENDDNSRRTAYIQRYFTKVALYTSKPRLLCNLCKVSIIYLSLEIGTLVPQYYLEQNRDYIAATIKKGLSATYAKDRKDRKVYIYAAVILIVAINSCKLSLRPIAITNSTPLLIAVPFLSTLLIPTL